MKKDFLASDVSSPVVIRVDGGRRVGFGHIARMLSLTHALKGAGFPPPVFCLRESSAPEASLRRLGYEVEILNCEQELLSIVDKTSPGLMIVDVPSPGRILNLSFHQRVPCVAAVVDKPQGCTGAHLFVNGQITAGLPEVEVREGIRHLRGPKYMLLGEEFSSEPRERKTRSACPIILVTMGGSDPHGATPRIAQDLWPIRGARVQLVLGPSFPHRKALEFCAHDPRFELIKETTRMRQLMEEADVAVTSVGVTLYELAATRTPTVILGQEPGQGEIASAFARSGFGINLGLEAHLDRTQIPDTVTRILDDSALRSAISSSGRDLVDGLGSSRVAEAIKEGLRRR